MPNVTSQDGTPITYDQLGAGPALILIVGAFNERPTGAPLAKALAPHFTIYNYDRRGRGSSGDTQPYAVEKEIEDLDALIQQAGGSAFVFAYSSGAILALRAAAGASKITKLVLYDPPPTGGRAGELAPQLAELIAQDKRGEAVELFQAEAVGIPPNIIAQLRNAPFRPHLEEIAHTLIYESTIMKPLPDGLAASVKMPTLIIAGENNPPIMLQSAQSLADALPNAQHRTLAGQGHDLVPEALTPILLEFLK